ncbi:hypothetical protein IT413_01480 [Candidatus Peregrinibacteria bacterium]|nr:hypothetical protein [Candidatus Peregrinibacteria bacterium]
MRLKVPPKEALKVIDQIIEKGFKVYSLSLKKGWMYDPALYQLDSWYAESKKFLNDIFLDFTPIYAFSKDLEAYTSLVDAGDLRQKRLQENNKLLLNSLDLLSKYYDLLEKDSYSPLFYIPEKAQICFFTSISQLDPNSMQSDLCKYLFQSNFNQFHEKEDIFKAIFREDIRDFNADYSKKINTAMECINEKTIESFGFPIVKKRKTLLALTIPSRFLTIENTNIASSKA